MRLRHLGFKAQELESGNYTFLISDSVPVAYRLIEGDTTSYFRVSKAPGKGAARHMNLWLKDRKFTEVSAEKMVQAFESLSDRRADGRLDDKEWLEFQLWKAEQQVAKIKQRIEASK